MKKLQRISAIELLFVLLSIAAYSQGNRSTWLPGSTSGSVIYDPKIDLPIRTTPVWTEISVNPENTNYKLIDNKLNVKTIGNSIFGYQLNGTSFLPKDTFTLDLKGENLTDTASFGVNIRLSKGKNIKLKFMNGSIVDTKSNTTLVNGLSTMDMKNYRVVVAKDEAALYKDFDFINTLNTLPADTIADGGFEKMTSTEAAAYWGHDGYTGVSVVTDQKHTGTKSMKWENGWNGRFMGVIKVQPNSSYTFTFWAKLIIVSAWGQTQMNGGIWIAGQQVANLPIKGDWTKYTYSFTTGPCVDEIALNYHNGWTSDGNFSICFDDMQLTRTAGDPFLQIGNLFPAQSSDINIGKISYLNGKALKPVSLNDLTQLISNCQILLAGSQPGNATGNYPQYAIDRFSTEINRANQIAILPSVSAESIDLAFANLQNATDLFKRSKITNPEVILTSISATADVTNLKSNNSAQITVTGKLSNNNAADLSVADIQYTSLNPALLSVDSIGKVIAISPGAGEVEVVVQLNNVLLKDTVDFTLIDYNLASVEFSPFSTLVEAGEATGTQFIAKMTDGTIRENSTITPIYRSLTPTIATVNDIGTIIAQNKGLAKIEISVTVFGKTVKDTSEISIISLESITLSPVKTTLAPNETSVYSLTANYSDGSTLSIDNSNAVIWSKNRNVINIDDKGHIKADSVGSADIQFVLKRGSVSKIATVTLNVVKNATGFEAIELNLNHVFPVPFNNSFTINSTEGIKKIQLTDLSGKRLISVTFNNENTQVINASSIQPGIYLLNITDSKGKTSVSKVIKN